MGYMLTVSNLSRTTFLFSHSIQMLYIKTVIEKLCPLKGADSLVDFRFGVRKAKGGPGPS